MENRLIEDDEDTQPKRQRVPHIRNRYRRHLLQVNENFGLTLYVPSLAELMSWSEDEFLAKRAGLLADIIAHAPKDKAEATPKLPAVATQIRNFVQWQRQHESYYWWDDDSLDILRRRMERESGCELIFSYAHSCHLRLRDGLLLHLNRDGTDYKSQS